MRPTKALGVEFITLEHATPEVVHYYIRLGDQSGNEVAVRWQREVGGQTLLVAIDAEEIRALPRFMERWSPAASIVSEAWAFHFDDVGPEITEHHRAEWPSEDSSEVQDSYAREHNWLRSVSLMESYCAQDPYSGRSKRLILGYCATIVQPARPLHS